LFFVRGEAIGIKTIRVGINLFVMVHG
jgi:hypothetical protein